MKTHTPEIMGSIRYEGVRDSKGVRRWIDRRIRQWITGGAQATRSSLRYVVTFKRESGSHQLACEVVIAEGARSWRGTSYGRQVQQAFLTALAHLMPRVPVLVTAGAPP